MSVPETAVDRRLARGVETRRRLAEAMIALLEEGVPQPSAREIAERAGVSLRLVFHHFEDMEQVLRAAVAVQVSRHWNRLHPVDPSLPLGERVERIIRQRETLYEAIAPVRRAAARAELESPTIATELSRARRQLRRGLEATFEAELHSASHDERLDALDVAGSWETWDLLRTRMGVGRAAARRVVARMMTSLLEDQGGSK